MRLVTVSPQETAFLAQEVKQKYETISGEELVITSYLARYEGLMEVIKAKTTCFSDVDIVSPGLLRKLLESGKNLESTTINRKFVDACYLFITDCEYNRIQYIEKFGTSAEHESGEDETERGDDQETGAALNLSWPFKGERLQFTLRKDLLYISMLCIAALLTWAVASNWQYLLLQVPSRAPNYLWWVAEYPDGTRVYNHFRRYRTEKEVTDYFWGRGIEEGTHKGDCNAIYWKDNTRINACYDTIETIRKFENEHGGKPEIRFDG